MKGLLPVRIAVTGSIATDHLMSFPGKFEDSLVVEQLDKISLSFLVEDLEIHRGGCAANIAFGMGLLGVRPILVGAVGKDFDDYRSWLERHNVDCDAVHVSADKHTARFVATTDVTQAQIATFYAGAMSEAREIELGPIAARYGGLDLVLIGPNDPEAIRRHTDECRQRGIPFAADPSQQAAWADGPTLRTYVEGATYLFSNEYEAGLIEQKTEWTADEILSTVDVRVTTLGGDGVRIDRRGRPPIEVSAAPINVAADPTGVGDGFRAGFLSARGWGLSLERAAQVGCVLAAHVIEVTGPQEYHFDADDFLKRLGDAYGSAAVADVEPHLVRSRR